MDELVVSPFWMGEERPSGFVLHVWRSSAESRSLKLPIPLSGFICVGCQLHNDWNWDGVEVNDYTLMLEHFRMAFVDNDWCVCALDRCELLLVQSMDAPDGEQLEPGHWRRLPEGCWLRAGKTHFSIVAEPR